MIHPLIGLVATRPELLSEHLGAYAQLATAESIEALAQLRRRSLWAAALFASLVLGLGLGGGALMLVAVVPLAEMPVPALLAAVAVTPWLAAGLCLFMMQGQPPSRLFPLLRQQLQLDGVVLQEAGKTS